MASQHQSPHDRFYGQRARPPSPSGYPMREGYDTPPDSPDTSGAGKLHDKNLNIPPPLVEFIAYALYRTRLPLPVVHQALFLLARLKSRYPSARGTSTSPHRLFLSALMLSSKIVMDDTYSNKSWAIVGGNLFTLHEVNQMERELFSFLGCNVVVRPEELEAFVVRITSSRDLSSPTDILDGASADQSCTKRRRHESVQEPLHASSNGDRDSKATDAAVALLRGYKGSQAGVRPFAHYSPPATPHSSKFSRPASTMLSPCSSVASSRSPATPSSGWMSNASLNRNSYSTPSLVSLSRSASQNSSRGGYGFHPYPSPVSSSKDVHNVSRLHTSVVRA